ncbi:response regulator transcription factor [Halobacterium sp. KA-6]|uniref:response regulator transcription factor n=1 Tax=Halobacterium sp. KA-6 TaxID=2896368 RepID=UPI001E61CE36|nr:response regulator [Halobacterium sp. KA-6]MCD2202614.1 response regulator [Halobacterium sp. KA-6]
MTGEGSDDASADEATVLVVDDEEGLADLYAIWLRDRYTVETAYDGEAALTALDEDVDVVLLDRQMPGVSGDDVLDTIRERGLDCRVAMVTAVEPELDIVDLGFDDYLRKPVDRETLRETVDRLLRRSAYDETVQRYFAAARKHALLTESNDPSVTESTEFETLEDRLDDLRSRLDDVVDEFDEDDYEVLFRRLSADDE